MFAFLYSSLFFKSKKVQIDMYFYLISHTTSITDLFRLDIDSTVSKGLLLIGLLIDYHVQ